MKTGFFLIPARAGSSGLRNKNVTQFGGKTLIQRVVEGAVESEIALPIVLSSDSEDYLRPYQSQVITHLRGSAADDKARAIDVVKEFVANNEQIAEDAIVIYLQPTSPLRTGEHIRMAYEKFIQNDGAPLCSVTREGSSKFEKFLRVENGLLFSPFGEKASANRQDLGDYVYPNGAIYIFQLREALKKNSIPLDGATPFFMDRLSSWDIDSAEDLHWLEKLTEPTNG